MREIHIEIIITLIREAFKDFEECNASNLFSVNSRGLCSKNNY